MKLNSKSINYNVQTVDELVSLDGLEGDTVVVTDENRGGVFIYRADGTSNGGTIFDSSSTGKWHRQYEGSVNVKWFGADIQKAMVYALENSKKVAFDFNATIRIPKDSPTLQQAIDSIEASQGVTIDLLIESGHQPVSGVSVNNGDFSCFQISSEDNEVTLHPDFSGIVVRATYATAPTLNCLINANKKDSGGYWCDNNSRGKVNNGCGIINSGDRAIYSAHGSSVQADGCIISGSSAQALWCTTGSTINAEDMVAHDCENVVFYCSRNSRINASNSRALNCTGKYIAWCKRPGTINIHDSELSGSTEWAIWADFGGVISAHNTDIGDVPLVCFRASNGGVIQASSKTFGASPAIVGSGVFAQAQSQGRIALSRYIIDGFSGGLVTIDNSNISANGIIITNSTGNGVFCQDASTISLRTARIKYSGTKDIAISHGGIVAARLCETTNGIGQVALNDTNASALDTLTRSGVIFAGG